MPFPCWICADADTVSLVNGRAAIPAIQKSYATVPAVASTAQTPAVQRAGEPKKGVMDYVLTSADAVLSRSSNIAYRCRSLTGPDKVPFGR
jgi:hypothetical protein